jgi:hypothetical protein
MPIRTALLALPTLALALLAPSAFAGTPGKWTMVGSANLVNIDEVSLARTADNTLHAVWTVPSQNTGGAGDALMHAGIAPNGGVAAPNAITSGWATISSVPDVITSPDGGLRVFFGGLHSTDVNDPNSNMNTATAPASGAAWSLFPGTVVKGDAAYGSDTGASAFTDGTPVISWGGTGSGVFVHRGLDPSTPNFALHTPSGGCCNYSPDVAVDASGASYVAWISNATGDEGVWVQGLDPASGQPTGVPVHMPGSSSLFNGTLQSSQQLMRISTVPRVGGGVYIAYSSGYPTTTKAIVWKVGTAKEVVVASSKGGHIVGMAAAPGGYLWLVWIDRTSATKAFAARSNKSGTKWGPAVPLGSPPGQNSAYKIAGNAQANTLDVVALWGNASSQAQFHTQALPGLDLTASPTKVNGKKATTITFTVKDPDAVKGAKVSIGGKSDTTDGAGHAQITVGPTKAKSVTAFAKKAGYTSDKVKIKIKH